MPTYEKIVRVFVASPKDVEEERILLEEIIQELNQTWSKQLSLQLRLVKWETDTYPDIGRTAQTVINNQIEDNYDIFIGIFWKRFGTSTGKSGSGTENEFNRAYEKFKRNPKEISILFYFKKSPIPFDDIDPIQISKIKNFRKSLGAKGTFYWEYNNIQDFEKYTRVHISKHAQEWAKKTDEFDDKKDIENEPKSTLPVPENDQEEEGLIDLIEKVNAQNTIFTESMERMTAAINDLRNKMQERIEEIDKYNTSSKQPNLSQVKAIVSRTVINLNQFSTRMKTEVVIFSESYSEVIDNYTKMIEVLNEFDNAEADDINERASELESMLQTINDAKINTEAFRNTLLTWPKLASILNRARRNTVETLSSFLDELSNAESLTGEAIKALRII
jgi:hypothetical protein